eukprot:TRINITY_DN11938_c0_g1_i3.p1 TRINITY_DN11938_c0_g1~~TRINITY_DN11938_c0_g1_i3.p1  ORF type:complete len:333 (-),score=27.93 TRINITY_DN11938_c0_g1_i3:111-1109(-)
MQCNQWRNQPGMQEHSHGDQLPHDWRYYDRSLAPATRETYDGDGWRQHLDHARAPALLEHASGEHMLGYLRFPQGRDSHPRFESHYREGLPYVVDSRMQDPNFASGAARMSQQHREGLHHFVDSRMEYPNFASGAARMSQQHREGLHHFVDSRMEDPNFASGAARMSQQHREGLHHFVDSRMEDPNFASGAARMSQRGDASFTSGKRCSVRKHKHGKMGCAVVLTSSTAMRDGLLDHIRTISGDGSHHINIGGRIARVQRHLDKYTGEVAPTEVYISWGNASEKEAPLPIELLVDVFDTLISHVLDRNRSHAPEPEDIPSCRFRGGGSQGAV